MIPCFLAVNDFARLNTTILFLMKSLVSRLNLHSESLQKFLSFVFFFPFSWLFTLIELWLLWFAMSSSLRLFHIEKSWAWLVSAFSAVLIVAWLQGFWAGGLLGRRFWLNGLLATLFLDFHLYKYFQNTFHVFPLYVLWGFLLSYIVASLSSRYANSIDINDPQKTKDIILVLLTSNPVFVFPIFLIGWLLLLLFLKYGLNLAI